MPNVAERFTLAVCMPVWKRHGILRIVINQWAYLRGVFDHDGIDIRLLAGISRPEDAEQLPPFVEVVETPNEPLNEKHDRLTRASKSLDPDAMMIVNSDDLFTPAYIEAACESIAEYDVVRLRDFAYFDMGTQSLRYAYNALPASGTCMSPYALDALDWSPWHGRPIDKMLDTRLYENLVRTGSSMKQIHTSPGSKKQGLSLKSDENLWSFDEHLRMIEAAGGEVESLQIAFVGHYFSVVAPLIDQTIRDDENQRRGRSSSSTAANGTRRARR